MDLTLDEREVGVLARVLENYLPQLREEVYKTENFEMREALKRDEEVIKSLMSRLGTGSRGHLRSGHGGLTTRA
jgi:hypothetical protein